MITALEEHWRQYLIEGTLLGLFMISACFSVSLVEHAQSPIRRAVTSPLCRRAVIGALMGLTGIALIYSPWGKLSGAHMNPATTLAFFCLGKIEPVDALSYVASQSLGGFLGVLISAMILPRVILHPPVACVTTQPRSRDRRDLALAFMAEWAMTLTLFLAVLICSNHLSLAPYTGIVAGTCLMLFITFEAPVSGMSLNPARTLGSALVGRTFPGLWIYFVAPPLGMLTAAVLYSAVEGRNAVYCAKLDHSGDSRCIFHCRIEELRRSANPPVASGIQALTSQSPKAGD